MGNAKFSDDIIIGQEAIHYWGSSTPVLGRVKSFSSWDGVTEYVIFQPHFGPETKVTKPESIELIDPRPRTTRFMDFFRQGR